MIVSPYFWLQIRFICRKVSELSWSDPVPPSKLVELRVVVAALGDCATAAGGQKVGVKIPKELAFSSWGGSLYN